MQLMLNVYYLFSGAHLSYLPTESRSPTRENTVLAKLRVQGEQWRKSPNNIVKAVLEVFLW
jgi:hypothetical protein